MKRVLVIGNGFDLAHGLPTTYMDFLYLASLYNSTSIKDYKPKNMDTFNDVYKLFTKDYANYCGSPLSDNIWINYILRKSNECSGDNRWTNFENIIHNVCMASSNNEELSQKTKDEYKEFIYDNHFNLSKMKLHLQELINLLDAYLNCVDSLNTIVYSPDILQFLPNYVINFNYTSTFENFYTPDIETDYIHGKLSNVEQKNSIVLGFNSMNDDNNNVLYAEFLKFFQMVNKDVKTKCYSVIDNEEEFETMFFGHSLDLSDESILRDIINKSKRVYIIYRNSDHKNSLIKNLLKLFKEDEFIKKCLGANKSVFFIKQRDMEPYSSNVKVALDGYIDIVFNKPSSYEIITKNTDVLKFILGPIGCVEALLKLLKYSYSYRILKSEIKLKLKQIEIYFDECEMNKVEDLFIDNAKEILQGSEVYQDLI